MNRITVPIGLSGQVIIYEPEVLTHFKKYKQCTTSAKEAGGQLFAKFEKNQIRIRAATGPRPSDKRSRISFVPNRALENAEILKMFKRGLHYVGDWHTHPEKYPRPSATDVASMRDCYKRSNHRLNFFILTIVGNDPQELCFSTTLCNHATCTTIDEQF